MTKIRSARESDLDEMYAIFLQNERRDTAAFLTVLEPDDLRFTVQTGTVLVAERDGAIRAFAGAVTREGISFLTDLFVEPAMQSSQLGKILLQAILPVDGLVHCTMSSSDPRALGLYIRSGMRPQWPHFVLRLQKSSGLSLPESEVEIVEADPTDPALLQWDRDLSGRSRPLELHYWCQHQRAVPIWFQRQKKVVGYAYVRLGAGTLTDPNACTLGPLGVRRVEDATACVLAAVQFALQRAEVVCIDVPGPHPCLKTLLERGFRIIDVETFVSSAEVPFFDEKRYIASSSNLL